jgi:ketol-acid reductoisomerase
MTPQIEKIKNEMAALMQDVIDGIQDPAEARQWIYDQVTEHPDLSDFGQICIEQIEGA